MQHEVFPKFWAHFKEKLILQPTRSKKTKTKKTKQNKLQQKKITFTIIISFTSL